MFQFYLATCTSFGFCAEQERGSHAARVREEGTNQADTLQYLTSTYLWLETDPIDAQVARFYLLPRHS